MQVKGVGWWLTLVDMLCSEYGWSLQQAFDTPLSQALCLRAAIASRNGSEVAGGEFLQRELIKRLKER